MAGPANWDRQLCRAMFTAGRHAGLWLDAGRSLDLFEGGPAEQQDFLADTAEVDRGFGPCRPNQ